MWENSSAYSRSRFEDKHQYNIFEDIAPISSIATTKTNMALNNTLTSTNKNANKANYNNIEKLILCLMETLQWLHLEVQPIFQVILLSEQKYLQRSTKKV